MQSDPGADQGRRPSPDTRLVESLIALMEAGTTPWRREWDGGGGTAGGGHHVNLISGRRYRGANPILLTLGLHQRGSCLPYWCGFAEARARGLTPRRGSRAVHVLRPQLCPRPGAMEADSAAPAPASAAAAAQPAPRPRDAASQGWVRYRPVAVFNAADLEGEALDALLETRQAEHRRVRRSEPERLQRAETTLGAWPVPVLHGGELACYLSGPDRIHLPDRHAFHTAGSYYATWAHEAIHSTGHPSRLARDLTGARDSHAYAREELVAELGAVLLGDRLEIGSDTRNHAAYLQHWIELLQRTPRLLFQVLSEARRAADLICCEDDGESPGPGSVLP
jgi:antirestriction protein ArdC